MCLTDGVYRQRGIHPIQLRAEERKYKAREGSRGLWAVNPGDGGSG